MWHYDYGSLFQVNSNTVTVWQLQKPQETLSWANLQPTEKKNCASTVLNKPNLNYRNAHGPLSVKKNISCLYLNAWLVTISGLEHDQWCEYRYSNTTKNIWVALDCNTTTPIVCCRPYPPLQCFSRHRKFLHYRLCHSTVISPLLEPQSDSIYIREDCNRKWYSSILTTHI